MYFLFEGMRLPDLHWRKSWAVFPFLSLYVPVFCRKGSISWGPHVSVLSYCHSKATFSLSIFHLLLYKLVWLVPSAEMVYETPNPFWRPAPTL